MKDPEERARLQAKRETAILQRERLIESARRLINRATLQGRYSRVPAPGDWTSSFVMRPETLDFLMRSESPLHERQGAPRMGDTPRLDGTPVLFSEDLELDQIILAYEGSVAGRDLKALADAGFLRSVGERRGRYYMASAALKTLEESIRQPREQIEDPFQKLPATLGL